MKKQAKITRALMAGVMVVSMMPSMAWATTESDDADALAQAATASDAAGESPADQALAALLAAGDPTASTQIGGAFASFDDALAYLGDVSADTFSHVSIFSSISDDGVAGAYTITVYASEIQNASADDAQAQADWTATLQAGWSSLSSSINILSFGYTEETEDDMYNAYIDAITQSPEFFNVRTGCGWDYISYDGGATWIVSSVSPIYLTTDASTYATMKSDFDAAVAEAMSQVSATMTDKAKAFVLHDWLVNRAHYDQYLQVTDGTQATAYGVLVNKTGVCQSYTMAYATLLKQAGIDFACLMVSSTKHAWNLAKIDGVWYHVDATWDDPIVQGGGEMCRHTYFLLSDTKIASLDTTHQGWTAGYDAGVNGWESSMTCTSTIYDNYNWDNYDPATDIKQLSELTATATTSLVKTNATAKVIAAVEGADGAALSYQWQYSTNGGKTWSNTTLSSATKATLSLEATTYRANSCIYRCVVTAADGRKATTNSVKLSVLPALSAKVSTTAVPCGKTATFACAVTGADDGTTLSYQWQYRTSSTGSWKNCTATGSKTANYPVAATSSRKNYQYRCIVTATNPNEAGTATIKRTATTSAASILVSLKATVSTTAVKTGATASFKCSVSGYGTCTRTYQWQVSKDGGKTWANSTAATANAQTLKVSAYASRVSAGWLYRCVVSCGNWSATSTGIPFKTL